MKKSNLKLQKNNRQRQLLRARASDRRGVLLLVVLSILILFLLIGTTFILTAGQHKDRAKILEKANRTTFQPEDVLERALMQLVRDTNNRHSALRYHSLLRDVYGGDGFVGQVLMSGPVPVMEDFDGDGQPDSVITAPRFAGPEDLLPNNDLTNGQLVDLYVQDALIDDRFDPSNAVGLDLDSNGLPINYSLSLNSAYYNGCLLTLMEGPCRGMSVRIVDYDTYIPTGTINSQVLGRLRVMVPQRLDGSPISVASDGSLPEFYDNSGVGYRFIVNGRPHNGTGVGFNAITDNDDAKLTALEAIQDPSRTFYYGIELALAPNSTYFNQNGLQYLVAQAGNNPFAGSLPIDAFNDLRDGSGNSLYPNFPGPGDTDESYDAPDFQNMFLAHQSLTPRFRGRLRNPSNGAVIDPATYGRQDNAPDLINLKNVTIPSLHRPALANFWFHRLFNSDWLSGLSELERYQAILDPYGTLGNDSEVAAQVAAIKRRYSMRPTRDDHPNFDGSNYYSQNDLASGFVNPVNLNNGLITAPTWEIIGPWDVDNDGDGVPDSVWVDLGLPVQKTEDGRFYKPLVAMLVEDLDNRLNVNAHGSLDHFANTELDGSQLINGTLIKSNLAQDYNNPRALRSSDQLPTGMGYGPADISLRSIFSPRLPLYDIQTSSSLSGNPQYDDYARLLIGRPNPVDNGRSVADAMNLTVDFGRYGSRSAELNMGISSATPGKTFDTTDITSMGMTRESRIPYDFPGYPNFAGELYNNFATLTPQTPSGYGEVPDLIGRYATAVSAIGKPLYEAKSDFQTNPNLTLLDDSPYEIDLSIGGRRGVPSEWELVASSGLVSEDAPYSPAELERILRAGDADVGELPSRLWDVVDAFDPDKSVYERGIAAGYINEDNYAGSQPNSLQRVVAQATTSITRRQVTTDSYSLPVPNENWTSRLLLGADGLPGLPGVDDDNDGVVDNASEISFVVGTYTYTPNDGDPANDCDDYFVIMGDLPPSGARITDYLSYRIALEFAKNNTTPGPDDINNIMHGDDRLDVANVRSGPYTQGGMLAPEVLAGRKMNLNRPFGDGRDNNNNGTVDEPEEAGVPNLQTLAGIDYTWTDSNSDGVKDPGEQLPYDYTWVDLNNDGIEDPGEQAPFDYTGGKDVNGRGAVSGTTRILDDGPMARQLYARHLYCLMLAVMDENYLAPYDENDPQVLHYLDPFSRGSMAFQIRKSLQSNPPPGYPWPGYFPIPDPASAQPQEIRAAHGINARRIAMHKLTCRQVAQWAINCVDMRDPDSVQTPFEYDENPWDGWNVNANGTFFPLDGDLTTDENYGMYRSLSGGNFDTVQPADASVVPACLRTRGVVWGAERPEALLTEGLAIHDRRLEDLDLDPDTGGGKPDDDNSNGDDDGLVTNQSKDTPDNDLDQRLKPAGRTYVEIYNPWTDGANLAAELYRDANGSFRRYDSDESGSVDVGDDFIEGLLLDRVSEGRSANRLPSPVWRMACTETHPLVRNATIPDQATIEINDDPYTAKVAGGNGNGGKYFDLTITNGQWEYETNQFSPRIQDEEDDNSARNEVGNDTGKNLHTFAGGKTLPKLPKALLNYYQAFYDNTEGLLGLNTNSVIDKNKELAPRITDPDFPSFDRQAQPEDKGFVTVTISNPGLGIGSNKLERRVLAKPNEYLERIFYFTGAPSVKVVPTIGSVRDPINSSGLHIPNLFYQVTLMDGWDDSIKRNAGGDDLSGNETYIDLANDSLELSSTNAGFVDGEFGEPRAALNVYISRFPALDYFDTDGDHPTDIHDSNGPIESVPLSPILPGRYAVVGTAGEIFGKSTTTYDTQTSLSYDNLEDRYTTIISRSLRSTEPASNPSELEFINPPDGLANQQVGFRRIEMFPSTNPNRMQFIFRMNGGFKSGTRETELINIGGNSGAVNVTDPVQFSTVEPPDDTSKEITPAIQPVVAIPMEDFTISEPLDGYLIRQLELDPKLKQIFYKHPKIRNTSDDPAEGGFYSVENGRKLAGYDEPFDLLPELVENQTTPNYRAMHLQRLANPRLSWNPPPITASGNINDRHDPSRPVNPYLTIDSLSLDLTSLNSTSQKESELERRPADPSVNGPEVRHQVRRDPLPTFPSGTRGNSRPYTKITFQSQERGLHGAIPTTGEPLPSRTLWNQDRTTGSVEIFDRKRTGVSLSPRQKINFNDARREDYEFGTDEDYAGIKYREAVLDYPLRHSLGFANRAFGRFYNYETDVAGSKADDIDLDRDGVVADYDLIGTPEVTSDGSSDDATTPVFHWPNRPFISEGEVIQVPIWSSSRMLTYYSVYNAALERQPNQYDGEALRRKENDSDGNVESVPANLNNADEEFTNRERWRRTHMTFGHLPNFFMTSAIPSRLRYYVVVDDVKEVDSRNQPILNEPRVVCQGAPHFYRILDYLHVPSRFIGTDTLLDPNQFAAVSAEVDDPRRELAAPFNRVDNYREPGKVNLNTVVGQNDGARRGTDGSIVGENKDRWSEVYDGIMHRYKDENLIDYTNGSLIQMGHLGPAWRDIEKSRRGYTGTGGGLPNNPMYLNPNFPTFFANPFRAEGESLNVPLFQMRQEEVVAGRLRPHHYSPGNRVLDRNGNLVDGSAWGNRGNDGFIVDKDGVGTEDNNGIRNDANEAGTGDDQILRRNSVPQAVPNATGNANDTLPRIPLMSGAALEPSIDTERNSHLRYQPITRLSNLTTTRSGVFAVWMTVGFFEVTPASDNPNIAARYFIDGNADNGFLDPDNDGRYEDLFFRIYPDGYTLGREIGLDTGENKRHRGFYIVDRTRPVAFKPGEDLNVDDAVLLRRRIE